MTTPPSLHPLTRAAFTTAVAATLLAVNPAVAPTPAGWALATIAAAALLLTFSRPERLVGVWRTVVVVARPATSGRRNVRGRVRVIATVA